MKESGKKIITLFSATTNNKEWRLRLALLKENSDYRKFWDKYGGQKFLDTYFAIDVALPVEEKVKTSIFIAVEKFTSELTRFGIEWPFMIDDKRVQEFIHLIDPFSADDLPDPLPFSVFQKYPSVAGVFSESVPSEAQFCVSNNLELGPSERLLRIDLSRSRGDLLNDFRRFLDRVDYFRNTADCPEGWKENYQEWEPDRSRFRAEAWQALTVWQLRRQRKTYKEIKNTLNIEISTAKMAFRRAYELIEERPYNPEAFKRDNLPVSVQELPKTCETCPIRKTCKEICPDMLAFFNQDRVPQRELLVDALDLSNFE